MNFGFPLCPTKGGTLITSSEQTDFVGRTTDKRRQFSKTADANFFPLRVGEGDRGRGQGVVFRLWA